MKESYDKTQNLVGLDAFLAEEITVLKNGAEEIDDYDIKGLYLELAIAKIGAIKTSVMATRSRMNKILEFLPLENGVTKETDLAAMTLDETIETVATYFSVEITDETREMLRAKYSALFAYTHAQQAIGKEEAKKIEEFQDHTALNLPSGERELKSEPTIVRRAIGNHPNEEKVYERMSEEQILNEVVKGLNIAGVHLNPENHRVETIVSSHGSSGYIIILNEHDIAIFCCENRSTYVFEKSIYETVSDDLLEGMMCDTNKSDKIFKRENHIYRFAYAILERINPDFDGVLTIGKDEVVDVYMHKKIKEFSDSNNILIMFKKKNVKPYREFSSNNAPHIYYKKDVYEEIAKRLRLNEDESFEELELVKETYTSDEVPEGEKVISISTLQKMLQSTISSNIRTTLEQKGIRPIQNKFIKNIETGSLQRVYNYTKTREAIIEARGVDIETDHVENVDDNTFLFDIDGEMYFNVHAYLQRSKFNNDAMRQRLRRRFLEKATPHQNIKIKGNRRIRDLYPINVETLALLSASGIDTTELLEAATDPDYPGLHKIELAA